MPANVKTFAAQVPKVDNSTASPCWQQRQIAKQQAFLESTVEGAERVYQAKCDAKSPATKPAPAAPSTPKTS